MKKLLRLNLQHFADGDGEEKPPAAPVTPPPADDEPKAKTFTQDDINDIIEKRLERERKKFADYDDMKAKLEQFETAQKEREQADMTEIERLKAQLEEKDLNAKQLAEQLTEVKTQAERDKVRSEFIKVASGHNIAYIDDAIQLADLSAVKIDEAGKVVGVEDVVKSLVEHKPFLVAKKQPQQIGDPSNGNKDKAEKTAQQLLNEAAAQAKKTGKQEDLAKFMKLKRELGI